MKIILILLTLSKSNIRLTTKLTWEKLNASAFLLFLTVWASSFLIHLPFPNTVNLSLVTYRSLYSNSVTYRTSGRAIGHQVLPTQPLPWEAKDFPRGERHFNHVPQLTYLIYLSPKEVFWLVLFMHLRPFVK